jgi:hypothetical protein
MRFELYTDGYLCGFGLTADEVGAMVAARIGEEGLHLVRLYATVTA